jgi:hypothetical protein
VVVPISVFLWLSFQLPYPDQLYIFPSRASARDQYSFLGHVRHHLELAIEFEMRPAKKLRLSELITEIEAARNAWDLLDNCYVWPADRWRLWLLKDTIGAEAFAEGRMPDPLSQRTRP